MTDLSGLGRDADGTGPAIHARQRADLPAICGAPPGSPWTNRRAFVTCPACLAEIARRDAERKEPKR